MLINNAFFIVFLTVLSNFARTGKTYMKTNNNITTETSNTIITAPDNPELTP